MVKNTRIRQELLHLLASSKQPLSVPQLIKNISANKTSLYRQLESLQKNKLVLETDFGDGKKHYELSSLGHHHHLICNSCGHIEDICFSEKLLLSQIKSPFKIQTHHLEFFGLCANCQ